MGSLGQPWVGSHELGRGEHPGCRGLVESVPPGPRSLSRSLSPLFPRRKTNVGTSTRDPQEKVGVGVGVGDLVHEPQSRDDSQTETLPSKHILREGAKSCLPYCSWFKTKTRDYKRF